MEARPRAPGRTRRAGRWLALAVGWLTGCGSAVGPTPPVPPCDEKCQDTVALRALREMMKLAYNLTLQGGPVGPQQATAPCPEGGSVTVAGGATSNADQGTTTVQLTYSFNACIYRQIDEEAPENYRMSVQGVITQLGTLAAQPSTTTALVMRSEQMTLVGEVSSPGIPSRAEQCVVMLGQDGNQLSGTFCGRPAGVTF